MKCIFLQTVGSSLEGLLLSRTTSSQLSSTHPSFFRSTRSENGLHISTAMTNAKAMMMTDIVTEGRRKGDSFHPRFDTF